MRVARAEISGQDSKIPFVSAELVGRSFSRGVPARRSSPAGLEWAGPPEAAESQAICSRLFVASCPREESLLFEVVES